MATRSRATRTGASLKAVADQPRPLDSVGDPRAILATLASGNPRYARPVAERLGAVQVGDPGLADLFTGPRADVFLMLRDAVLSGRLPTVDDLRDEVDRTGALILTTDLFEVLKEFDGAPEQWGPPAAERVEEELRRQKAAARMEALKGRDADPTADELREVVGLLEPPKGHPKSRLYADDVEPVAGFPAYAVSGDHLLHRARQGWEEVADKLPNVLSAVHYPEAADSARAAGYRIAVDGVEATVTVEEVAMGKMGRKFNRPEWENPPLSRVLAAYVSSQSASCVQRVSLPGWKDGRLDLPAPEAMEELEIRAVRGYGAQADVSEEEARSAWRGVVETLVENRRAALVAGAGLGGVMLPELGLDTDPLAFTLHAGGRSRRGKSTAQRVAASTLGDPATVVVSWNTTGHRAVGERLAELRVLPAFYNETAAGGLKPPELATLAFSIGEGSRERSGQRGGLLVRGDHYRSILVSSGERDITSASTLEGILARVVEVHAPLFAAGQAADQARRSAVGAYGWPLAWFRQDPRLDEARAAVAEIIERLAEGHDGVSRTAAERCAVLVLGARRLGDYVGLGPELSQAAEAAAVEVLEDLEARLSDSHPPLARRLHEAVWEAFTSRPYAFPQRAQAEGVWNPQRDREGFEVPSSDDDPGGRLTVLRGKLPRIAAEAGIEDPMPALRELRETGDLIAHKRQLTGEFWWKRTPDGARERQSGVYVFGPLPVDPDYNSEPPERDAGDHPFQTTTDTTDSTDTAGQRHDELPVAGGSEQGANRPSTRAVGAVGGVGGSKKAYTSSDVSAPSGGAVSGNTPGPSADEVLGLARMLDWPELRAGRYMIAGTAGAWADATRLASSETLSALYEALVALEGTNTTPDSSTPEHLLEALGEAHWPRIETEIDDGYSVLVPAGEVSARAFVAQAWRGEIELTWEALEELPDHSSSDGAPRPAPAVLGAPEAENGPPDQGTSEPDDDLDTTALPAPEGIEAPVSEVGEGGSEAAPAPPAPKRRAHSERWPAPRPFGVVDGRELILPGGDRVLIGKHPDEQTIASAAERVGLTRVFVYGDGSGLFEDDEVAARKGGGRIGTVAVMVPGIVPRAYSASVLSHAGSASELRAAVELLESRPVRRAGRLVGGLGFEYRFGPGSTAEAFAVALHERDPRGVRLHDHDLAPSPIPREQVPPASFPILWRRDLRPDEDGKPYVVGADKHAAYLAACSDLELGLGAPERRDAPRFDKRLPGWWRCDLETVDGLPPALFAGAWHPSSIVELAIELNQPVKIEEAFVWVDHTRYLAPFYDAIRRTLASLDEAGDVEGADLARAATKMGYKTLLGGRLRSGANRGRIGSRPDWAAFVVAKFNANLARNHRKLAEAGLAPFAWQVDTLVVVSEEPDPALATGQALRFGTTPGSWHSVGSVSLPEAMATRSVGELAAALKGANR